MLPDKSAKLITALMLVFFSITSTAHATVESVPPINGASASKGYTDASVLPAYEACTLIPIGGYLFHKGRQLRIVKNCNGWNDLIPYHNEGWTTIGFCTPPDMPPNFSYQDWCGHWPAMLVLAVKCPIPSVNPTVPYVYNPDTRMCERPAMYNITLSGGGTTEPWHKKRDPDHSKSNLSYKAIVKDQNKQAKADFAVTITTDVTSDSGGHVHANGRPKGKLLAGIVPSTKAGKETISGTTNGSGVFEFTFGAEEASGTHTLTAKCDSGCKEPATATVKAKVEGLEPIPDGASFYTLTNAVGSVIGSTSTHKENHFLTPGAATILLNMASSYHAEIQYWAKPPKGKKPVPPLPLHLNDASLVGGGIFDIDADWDEPHEEHRRGTVIDIQANSKTGSIPSGNFGKFIELAKYYGAHAKIHSPGSDNQHFHVRLLNRKE